MNRLYIAWRVATDYATLVTVGLPMVAMTMRMPFGVPTGQQFPVSACSRQLTVIRAEYAREMGRTFDHLLVHGKRGEPRIISEEVAKLRERVPQLTEWFCAR